MIDREKVRKAIEHCLIPGNGGCDGCPYDGAAMCQAQLGLAVLELLKRIPDEKAVKNDAAD